MKNKSSIIIFLCLLPFLMNGQTTYHKNIEPIISQHCLPCHSSKNIGPMPLDNYYSVKAFAKMIYDVVTTKVMPPYQIEPSISHASLKQNLLQENEINAIKQWIDDGLNEGKSERITSYHPIDTSENYISIGMESSFEIVANKEEHTQIYVIPINNAEEIYTDKIQFFPGAKEFIKSAFAFIDTTEESLRYDKMDKRYGYTNYSSVAFKPKEYAWYGWNPYDSISQIKSGYLKRIPRNAKLLLQVTYKPNHKNYRDSLSHLKIWKVNKTETDQIIDSDFIIDSSHLIIKPFLIKQNELKTVIAERILDSDMEIHSLTPFGQNVLTAYNISFNDESGKNHPLLNIPQWDMHWKKTYTYNSPILIKKGSRIIVEALYNFTEENTRLPIIPLGRIPYGEGPKNELFLVVMDVTYHKNIKS
jgi:hypothetical protein